MDARFVVGLDQGTTSTRALLFDRSGTVVAAAQREHAQLLPRPGWVEHDPDEIWRNTLTVLADAAASAGATASDVAAIGISNQRETTLVWDRRTGQPAHNAIVWQDTRTQPIVDRLASDGGVGRFADRVGLPLSTYFAGTKLAWLLENVPGLRARADRGEALFGTVDSWLLWHLTGGPGRGVHATDATNASRTLFMALDGLGWDDRILAAFDVPPAMLPPIRSSSELYGRVVDGLPLAGVPIAAMLGDQQAATFGQAAFAAGDAKNTYGTGNFLIVNTGERPVRSSHGLLTTVAYRLGDEPPRYALEGSIAVTGSLVQWLRDNLGLIDSADDIEQLAASVPDNGGAYFVPAFSGLFAPHWRADARGALVGLTRFVNKGHLARAVLEATAYQTHEVIEAVNADAPVPLSELRVDGGMTVNALLMQFQADILGIPVVRPRVAETTALGAAYAAGLAIGFWTDRDELSANWAEGRRWEPRMAAGERNRLRATWAKAVTRTLDWEDGRADKP